MLVLCYIMTKGFGHCEGTRWVEIRCLFVQWLEKIYDGRECRSKAGAWLVLIFWPNLKLAMLVEVVPIKEKSVCKYHIFLVVE